LIDLKKVRRIIFVDLHGTTRAPMAAFIMKKNLDEMGLDLPVEIMARGLFQHFPEPLNPKSEAVLIGKGINTEGYHSEKFSDDEVTDKTIMFAMDSNGRDILLSDYSSPNEDNTFVLSYFVGEELETLNPYGEPIMTYGLCYEALKATTGKLIEKITE
jgi:protein-tyrosine-phosphatase